MQYTLGQIEISGHDAAQFLQGQLTCNVLDLEENQPQLFAYCNRQGRVIADGRIVLSAGNYKLLLPTNMLNICLKQLQHYALFSKVEFNLQDIISDDTRWHQADIQAGIAHVYPETSEKFLPHELNYHTTDTIDFNKGCYLGQEIIARMHYKATLKKQCYFIEGLASAALKPGTAIADTKQNTIGYLIDSARPNEEQWIGLALLPTNCPDDLKINGDVDAEIKSRRELTPNP